MANSLTTKTVALPAGEGNLCVNDFASWYKLKGIALKTADGMIAATALEHGLTVATRDTDFSNLGVTIFNPWALP